MMVDRGVERTSAKFGSLDVLFGRASACELPWRRAKIVSTSPKKSGADPYLRVNIK